MGLVQGESMAARFFNKLGASLLDRTICSSAGSEGLIHTLGAKVGMRVEFFAESRLILIWGSNSITSNLHFWRLAQEAKRAGARLVCIDPRRTETADKCHEHVQLLPGTDAALALALMHELIVNDWLDHDYIARYTLGWDALARAGAALEPGAGREVCGVQRRQIRALAREWGTISPAAIRLNYGMQRVRGGGNAVRAVACLPALTGAWRHRAGGVLLSNSGRFPVDTRGPAAARTAGRPHAAHHQHDHDRRRPAARGLARIRPDDRGAGGLQQQSGRGRARLLQGGGGFAREDLFTVVLEHFQTDTADYADYILPATTQLEHWDVHAVLRPHRCAAEPARHRAARRGLAQHAGLPRARAAHGLHRSLFHARTT